LTKTVVIFKIFSTTFVVEMSVRYQKILDFFRKDPRQSLYLRELARKLRKDPGNLSRELKKLTVQNKLVSHKRGNQLYFSLPLEKGAKPFLNRKILKEALKKERKGLVKLCQDLIRIPSVCGENPEEKIAHFIVKTAKEMGLSPKIFAKDKHRPNIVIDSDHSQNKNFLLLGHMDTIGVGEIENWRYHPFSGHACQERIYGRGAIDMKGGIACQLYTLRLIKDLRLRLPYNIRLVLVSNEEGGSTATPIFDLGMQYLVKEGLVEGEAAIYGYGGTYKIGIGHRGVLRVKITTIGESVHTGSVKWQEGQRGINAVTGMAEILLELEKIKLPKIQHPGFPRHGNVITPGVMILHGGTAVSTVPDRCESAVEVRFVPGLSPKKVFSQIKKIAEKVTTRRQELKVNLEKFVEIPAISLSPSEKIIQVLKKTCEEVYGQSISIRGTGPANESFMLIKKGIPTVVFGPIGGKAHSDNEFVYINSLLKTVEVYLLTISRLANSNLK
jgi:succinyl-diaminopimelate desuccinylase